MTAEALEEEESTAFTRGAALSLAATALFLLMCFLPVQKDGKWDFMGICENRKLLTTEIKGTLVGAAALLLIVVIKRRFQQVFSEGGSSAATDKRRSDTDSPAESDTKCTDGDSASITGSRPGKTLILPARNPLPDPDHRLLRDHYLFGLTQRKFADLIYRL